MSLLKRCVSVNNISCLYVKCLFSWLFFSHIHCMCCESQYSTDLRTFPEVSKVHNLCVWLPYLPSLTPLCLFIFSLVLQLYRFEKFEAVFFLKIELLSFNSVTAVWVVLSRLNVGRTVSLFCVTWNFFRFYVLGNKGSILEKIYINLQHRNKVIFFYVQNAISLDLGRGVVLYNSDWPWTRSTCLCPLDCWD